MTSSICDVTEARTINQTLCRAGRPISADRWTGARPPPSIVGDTAAIVAEAGKVVGHPGGGGGASLRHTGAGIRAGRRTYLCFDTRLLPQKAVFSVLIPMLFGPVCFPSCLFCPRLAVSERMF